MKTIEYTISEADAVRHLIVCDTQFAWAGVTNLTMPQMMDLQVRGWVVEGDDNGEFQLTEAGDEVVARALQHGVPKTLADVQPGGRVRLGDAPWPEIDVILADAYSAGAEGLPFEGIARRAAVRAAVAALSGQPSPGGQGDARSMLANALHAAGLEAAAYEVESSAHRGDEFEVYDLAAISAIEAALAARQPVDEVSVKKEDANNYCLILRALGMEEEGDPVAEVKALIEARDRQPVGEPIGWYTEDHLTDRSATTYDRTVADRWRAKGWPVYPLYGAPPVLFKELQKLRELQAMIGGQADAHG